MKVKMGVSIDEKLVERIDAQVSSGVFENRSRAVEQALREFKPLETKPVEDVKPVNPVVNLISEQGAPQENSTPQEDEVFDMIRNRLEENGHTALAVPEPPAENKQQLGIIAQPKELKAMPNSPIGNAINLKLVEAFKTMEVTIDSLKGKVTSEGEIVVERAKFGFRTPNQVLKKANRF